MSMMRLKGEKRGVHSLFPSLGKLLLQLEGNPLGRKGGGEEEMDIEAIIAETPSSGMEPLESPYGYNCYKVDIGDERYDTIDTVSSLQ